MNVDTLPILRPWDTPKPGKVYAVNPRAVLEIGTSSDTTHFLEEEMYESLYCIQSGYSDAPGALILNPGFEYLNHHRALVEEWWRDEGMFANPLEDLLEQKRLDEHYESLLLAIQTKGFTRPVSLYHPSNSDIPWTLGDGHHRLAIAIELGLELIPAMFHQELQVASDSGTWDHEDNI